MGVKGKEAVLGPADLGASAEVLPAAKTLLTGARDEAFLWPRRNALADGGGRGVTSEGESYRLGGEPERNIDWWFSGGGET